MNTIIRVNGHIHELRTVIRTVKYLIDTQPGFYTIEDIKNTINQQVESYEYFTHRMVVRALIKMIELKEQ